MKFNTVFLIELTFILVAVVINPVLGLQALKVWLPNNGQINRLAREPTIKGGSGRWVE